MEILDDLLACVINSADNCLYIAYSCEDHNDRYGQLYFRGKATAYESVAKTIRSLLAELDSAKSGRQGYVIAPARQ